MHPHEAQDLILKYLVAQTDPEGDKVVSAYEIAKQFPSTAKEIIYSILQKLATAQPPILVAHIRNNEIHSFEAFYHSNGLTEAFLEQGGFARQFQGDEALRLKKAQLEALDEEIKRDSLRLNKDTLKLNKLNKIFLVINAAMALFTLLWTVFKG